MGSGIDAEQPVDEGRLGPTTHGLYPKAELPLPEHPHYLEAFQRRSCRPHRLEPEDRPDQTLELAMVALEAVVEILHLPVSGLFRQQPLLLQLGDRLAIGWVLVSVDDPGLPVAAAPQRLGQEPLCCLRVASVGEVGLVVTCVPKVTVVTY